MILVDTSVWVDHLRGADPDLQKILDARKALMHSMIVGEIACGNLPNRSQVLRNMQSLPAIDELDHGDVLSVIESRRLMARGIGYVDTHLICSVLNREGVVLWTRDRRLKQVAEDLGVAYTMNA